MNTKLFFFFLLMAVIYYYYLIKYVVKINAKLLAVIVIIMTWIHIALFQSWGATREKALSPKVFSLDGGVEWRG